MSGCIRYRMIVWDFDGTLADTMALALASYNELAARNGFLPVHDPIAARSMGMLTFLRKHGIAVHRVPGLIKQYLTVTRGRMEAVRLFEGVPKVLRSLQASDSRLGVLSSNSADNIRACLRANRVEDVFEFIEGYPRLFGKATAIRRMLAEHKIERKSFLYIGDEVRDIAAAKKAGVDCAGVAWGFQASELLSQASPTFLWQTPAEVLAALLSK